MSAHANALLDEAAAAHGAAAFASIDDLNVSYSGRWHGLVARLQPALVDAGFRGSSEERLLPNAGLVAQAHTGPAGCKHVIRQMPMRQIPAAAPPPVTAAAPPSAPAAGADARPSATQRDDRQTGEVRVYFNGVESTDREQRAAAALVVDGYALFLLGPLLLDRAWMTQRGLVAEWGGEARIRVAGRTERCDVLQLRLTPGLGCAGADRLAVYIDRRERLMRRVRFTLNGLESTQGAVAEVDCSEHLTRFGVVWPTRFQERLLRPLPLEVHDWRLTGLDINRGYTANDLAYLVFAGRAFPPALPLA
jgi:hypothetical protein